MSQRGMVQVKERGQWQDFMPFVGNNPGPVARAVYDRTGLTARVVDKEGARMRPEGVGNRE